MMPQAHTPMLTHVVRHEGVGAVQDSQHSLFIGGHEVTLVEGGELLGRCAVQGVVQRAL